MLRFITASLLIMESRLNWFEHVDTDYYFFCFLNFLYYYNYYYCAKTGGVMRSVVLSFCLSVIESFCEQDNSRLR